MTSYTKDAFSDTFVAALQHEDILQLRSVPKGDLHCHALLGGDFQKWRDFEGIDLAPPPQTFSDFARFQDYLSMLFVYPWSNPSNEQVRGRVKNLFQATLDFAIADGLRLLEPSLDNSLLKYYEMDVLFFINEMQTILEPYRSKIDIRLDLGIMRDSDKDGLALLERRVYPLIETGFFRGLDLYADERLGEPELFVPFFDIARGEGMRLKAHAGELCDAEFVMRSVEILELDEVQHGIHAVESDYVMDFLKERAVMLNICPSSNITLGNAVSYAAHPIRTLMDRGVKVSVNSDDALIFGSSCSNEFLQLYKTGNFDAAELDQVRLNGLRLDLQSDCVEKSER